MATPETTPHIHLVVGISVFQPFPKVFRHVRDQLAQANKIRIVRFDHIGHFTHIIVAKQDIVGHCAKGRLCRLNRHLRQVEMAVCEHKESNWDKCQG